MNPKPSMPVGFRFRPTEEEIINYFLLGKVNFGMVCGRIRDLDIYKHEPVELYDADLDDGDGRMYFYTPLHKMNRSGQRAKRDAKGGFWRASQKTHNVLDQEGKKIGTKTSLVYYYSSAEERAAAQKTSWLMSEYRLLKDNTMQCLGDPNILEESVLCVVYNHNRSNKTLIFNKPDDNQMLLDHQSLSSPLGNYAPIAYPCYSAEAPSPDYFCQEALDACSADLIPEYAYWMNHQMLLSRQSQSTNPSLSMIPGPSIPPSSMIPGPSIPPSSMIPDVSDAAGSFCFRM